MQLQVAAQASHCYMGSSLLGKSITPHEAETAEPAEVDLLMAWVPPVAVEA